MMATLTATSVRPRTTRPSKPCVKWCPTNFRRSNSVGRCSRICVASVYRETKKTAKRNWSVAAVPVTATPRPRERLVDGQKFQSHGNDCSKNLRGTTPPWSRDDRYRSTILLSTTLIIRTLRLQRFVLLVVVVVVVVVGGRIIPRHAVPVTQPMRSLAGIQFDVTVTVTVTVWWLWLWSLLYSVQNAVSVTEVVDKVTHVSISCFGFYG